LIVFEQSGHGQDASVWGLRDTSGLYLVASSFENIMSKFLQLAVFVVLTTVLIFQGSAESKDGDERLEAKVDAIFSRLNDLEHQQHSS
jgi:hypothetical protein